MKDTTFISHIQPRSHDDRFPIPIHDPFVRWKCCRLTLTRLNVITVMVKIKLTTRTLDFLGRLVWEHLDFDKPKSPTEAQFVVPLGWSQS
jgi:hypothetical protein